MKCSSRNIRIFRLAKLAYRYRLSQTQWKQTKKKTQSPNSASHKNDSLLLGIINLSYMTILTKSTDPLPFCVEHVYTHVLIWKKDTYYCKYVIVTVFCHLLITNEATFASFWLNNLEKLYKKVEKRSLWCSIFQ